MVKVAILHEGKSDKSLDNKILKLLLNNLGFNENQVEFFGFGNKSNFYKLDNIKYSRLKLQIDEELISKVLFVVDADYEANDKTYGGHENTLSELNNIRQSLDMEDISDIYVTCDPVTKDGYLESLILSSIPQTQKECIETFLKCSEFKSKENHKAILNQIYNSAYPDAPYDFSHQNFNDLKQKLKNLFEEQ
ncbi:MAG: hypothetical protein U9N33_12055 [Campylobacterota bacterium]|nr:hypothetical protein [Campylobacterota bacterium]